MNGGLNDNRFEARDQATMYNADVINVYQDGGEPAVVRRLWMAPSLPAGLVQRPELAGPLLELVCGAADGPVAVAGVHGTGGFGKTTLATWLCHQPQVQVRFPGGLLWVTIGEHAAGAELAGRINNLVEQLAGERPGFTDAMQAGFRLGELLDAGSGPVLLVVDDVWQADQLDPLCQGGTDCQRLVTTRRRGLVPAGSSVWVDRMDPPQATAVLMQGLSNPSADLVAQVLAGTGRWPVLLAVANRTLVRQVEDYGATVAWALTDIIGRLAEEGPASLDLDDPAWRGRAVAATVRAGLDLLEPGITERFAELAIFGEDVEIPLEVLQRLWGATGGLTRRGTQRVCAVLAGMSLVQRYRAEAGTIRLHDIIRAYLLHSTDVEQRRVWHGLLLDNAATLVAQTDAGLPAWWLLPAGEDYLTGHLAEHLYAAGRYEELTATMTNLRWVTLRLQGHGPSGVDTDLVHIDTPAGTALARAIRQNAHLLAPITPKHTLGAILVSRLGNNPDLRRLVEDYLPTLPTPQLIPRWTPPDLPHPALHRTLSGHTQLVEALVVAPDGSWLASASRDGTVRVWDPETGGTRHTLTGHTGWVEALVVAPDGSWLASASRDKTVRIWDPDTGGTRHTLTGHTSWMEALVVAPDGSWLASASYDGTVRIWDPDTGGTRHTLTGHTGWVAALVVAPDRSWLASASYDGTVRIWDPDTGGTRHTLTGHTSGVEALVVAPDGSWLASASRDKTVRIWDPDTGGTRHTLTGHTSGVEALVVAPDRSWLASASRDKTVRIWDPDTGGTHHTPTGHTSWMEALVVAPDGSWLASASDRTVRIWELDTGGSRHTLTGHTHLVRALVVAPDGSWLASASDDETVRIWDPDTGGTRHTLTGHTSEVEALVVAPDGSWLASASDDETVRIWDPDTGGTCHTLTGHTSEVIALVVAPDGSWLASASYDGTARIWDPDTGGTRHTLTGHTGWLAALVVAPDGSWLASASRDKTVRIWDPDTGGTRHTLTGHTSDVEALAVAPDGSWLASASYDGTARIWDPDTGKCAGVARVDGGLTTCTWLPNNQTILCADTSGSLHAYDFLLT